MAIRTTVRNEEVIKTKVTDVGRAVKNVWKKQIYSLTTSADVGEPAPKGHAQCHYQMLLPSKWQTIIFPLFVCCLDNPSKCSCMARQPCRKHFN